MYKILYTTLLSILLLFSYTSYAFESYEEVQQYENMIFQEGEQILSEYNDNYSTQYTFSNIDKLPNILENLVAEGKNQEAGLVNEYFRLKNRTPISQLVTPTVEENDTWRVNY